jgi:ectoine hydroxylase-related dioxygenase (phytanoyl-CoA dioxygenase family)
MMGAQNPVTQDHIERYQRDGCVLVKDVFSPAEIAALVASLDKAAELYGTPGFEALGTDLDHQNPPTVHRGDGQVQLRNFSGYLSTFNNWLHNSIAGEVVASLMGAKHVRFWMDATFIKDGAGVSSATPWHNDECTFPFRGEMMPSLWVALTDVGLDNAPMLTLRGSNKDPWRYHSAFSDPNGFEVDHIPWSHLEARVARPDAPIDVWPCKAGDILLIHPKTIHGSMARTAAYEGRRIALTTRWLGDDVTWAPNSLSIKIPKLEATGLLKRGQAPPDALFPIIWPKIN